MKDYFGGMPLQPGVESSSKQHYRSSTKYLLLLLIGKLFKSIGIFLAYDLLKNIHIIQLLFYSLCVASPIFLMLQSPFTTNSTKRLGKFQYTRLIKYTLVHTFIELMWLFGLTLCGPFRTTLLFEQSQFVVICALRTIFLSPSPQTSPSRTRGVVVLFTATLIIFGFDFDHINRRPQIDPSDPNKSSHPHGLLSNIFSFLTSWLDISDHKGGVLLLVISLFFKIGFNHSSFSRVLLTDIGGSKRLKALSTFISTILISPWAIYSMFSSNSNIIQQNQLELTSQTNQQHSWIYYVLPVIVMSLFIYVIDFYLDTIVNQKNDGIQSAKYGSIFIFTWAGILSLVWNHPHVTIVIDKIKTVVEEEHALSVGVLIAFFMYIIATNMLSTPISQQQRGSFIGYSSLGSPLYSLTGEANKTSASLVVTLKHMLREVVMNPDSKKIFYFLCLNLAFTFVELAYGAFANSLGLLSDGIHMLFDCSALVMGLLAAIISQWKPTRIYSYGFSRVEILAGFINGLFLVVISIFIFIEAIERLIETPEIKSEKLIYVSFIGLCVNLFGIFAFSHAHLHSHDQSKTTHTHSHSHQHTHAHLQHTQKDTCDTERHTTIENDNMRAVFLHVVADTMGSVSVIISSLLIQQFGWHLADPICSICIAVMIFISVIPLIKHSSRLLLLKSPAGEKGNLYRRLLQRINNIDGVVSYRDERLWQMSSSSYVATLHVQISQTAYEQLISSQIQSILKEMKLNYLTVQLEKGSFFQHLSGLGASMGQIDESKSVFNDGQINRSDLVNIEKFV